MKLARPQGSGVSGRQPLSPNSPQLGHACSLTPQGFLCVLGFFDLLCFCTFSSLLFCFIFKGVFLFPVPVYQSRRKQILSSSRLVSWMQKLVAKKRKWLQLHQDNEINTNKLKDFMQTCYGKILFPPPCLFLSLFCLFNSVSPCLFALCLFPQTSFFVYSSNARGPTFLSSQLPLNNSISCRLHETCHLAPHSNWHSLRVPILISPGKGFNWLSSSLWLISGWISYGWWE